ncbi:hypothetical protein MRX96_021685 [Rhipicephalus microplus]
MFQTLSATFIRRRKVLPGARVSIVFAVAPVNRSMIRPVPVFACHMPPVQGASQHPAANSPPPRLRRRLGAFEAFDRDHGSSISLDVPPWPSQCKRCAIA